MTDEDRASYRRDVEELSSLGHRGSATENERRAAEYLAAELRGLGLEVTREAFQGSRSWGWRHFVHVLVAAIGLGCVGYSPVATTLLGMVALASFWFEGETGGPWLSRSLVGSESENVLAHFLAGERPRLRVVVCGHYDSQRTGLIWRIGARLAPTQWRLPVALKPPLLPIAAAMAAQVLLGGAAMSGLASPWWIALGGLTLAIYAIYGALFVQWAMSPYVPGAIDNASGAAAVLALGRKWSREPIPGVEAVFLLSGCEESGLLGAIAWADRHQTEVRETPTTFLNLDGLGMGPPCFLGWDVPVVGRPVAYPPKAMEIARAVTTAQRLTDAGPHSLPGPTDGLALLKRGLPGVTVVGFRGQGEFPNYHMMSDTADVVDYESANDGVEFAWALLRRLVQEPVGR